MNVLQRKILWKWINDLGVPPFQETSRLGIDTPLQISPNPLMPVTSRCAVLKILVVDGSTHTDPYWGWNQSPIIEGQKHSKQLFVYA